MSTQKALREVFKTHGFDKELRAVDREATEESPGSIVYSVDVSPTVSTDDISADILAIDGAKRSEYRVGSEEELFVSVSVSGEKDGMHISHDVSFH